MYHRASPQNLVPSRQQADLAEIPCSLICSEPLLVGQALGAEPSGELGRRLRYVFSSSSKPSVAASVMPSK
jgi:hypothetical protein